MNHLRSEKLTRFIFSKRHFSVEKRIVKYGAFIPPPDSPDLSVFCISALSGVNGYKPNKLGRNK